MHNPSDIFMGKNIVFPSWGPFLESLGNFSGPKSNFQIKIKKKIAGPGFIRLQDNSSPHFFLSDSRVSEMRAQMKITHTRKGNTCWGEWKMRDYRQSLIFLSPRRVSPFLAWVIFMRTRVLLALLSLRKNGDYL